MISQEDLVREKIRLMPVPPDLEKLQEMFAQVEELKQLVYEITGINRLPAAEQPARGRRDSAPRPLASDPGSST